MDTKRAYKLQEFVAHASDVNCVKVGKRTSRILITGGEDQKVNVWAIGKPSAVLNRREYFEPASVVRSMTFNKDGKSLFCGLHVLSWEPIICHDVVDIGWSTLGDLIVHEGKLVGCSYNQSCVGVWIVDLMKIEPYAVSNAEEYLNGSVNRSIQADNSISSVLGRLSVSSSPDNETSSSTLHKPSTMPASKEVPVPASSAMTQKLPKAPVTSNHRLTRSDSVPVLSPRVRLNPKFSDDQKRQIDYLVPVTAPRAHSKVDPHHSTLPLVALAPTNRPRSKISAFSSEGSSFIPVADTRHSPKRRRSSVAGEQSASAGDEDNIADLMENHQEFIHAVKSRLTKLEVVYRCWQDNDVNGCLDATQRMQDLAVTADIISVLMENTNCITLDICTCILPLASSVLESSYDRHLKVALEMILKLVKSFGATISSTLSFTPVGVDIEAEQRFQRCNLCFQELIKIHSVIFTLTRRQGEVGRSAQELTLFLQAIFQQSSR
uniref:Katanin p80 subunit C-terminal domain-containing protein n=1 Tax=Leersia perrieri TaxID=77586 RepID=A0A0D9XL08_9ORYZ